MTKDTSTKYATIVASVLSAATLALILVVVPALIAHINDTYAMLDEQMLEFRVRCPPRITVGGTVRFLDPP